MGGCAPTLAEIMPRFLRTPFSECMMRLPTGCPTESGGEEPRLTDLPSPKAELCKFRSAAESFWYDAGGEIFEGTEAAIGPYRAIWEIP